MSMLKKNIYLQHLGVFRSYKHVIKYSKKQQQPKKKKLEF